MAATFSAFLRSLYLVDRLTAASVYAKSCSDPRRHETSPFSPGILVGINHGTIRVPRAAFPGAQAVVGCLIATTITPTFVASFVRGWPIFLAVVFATIAASSVLGWLMSQWRVLPGTTGVWGSSPVSVKMHEAHQFHLPELHAVVAVADHVNYAAGAILTA